MKKALSLILALAMILALTACGSKTDAPSGDGDTQTDTPAEKIVLKIGHVEAEDRSTHKALLIFKDEIESKTDGRIEVQIFPNAELGGDEELCESVAMGTIQMALPSTSVLTAYNERIGVLDMPYLFTDARVRLTHLTASSASRSTSGRRQRLHQPRLCLSTAPAAPPTPSVPSTLPMISPA